MKYIQNFHHQSILKYSLQRKLQLEMIQNNVHYENCTLYIAAIDNNQTKHYRFTCSSIYVLYTLIASIFKGTWSQEGTGGAEPAHTNHPNFHLKERLVNLRRRECFVCLYLIIMLCLYLRQNFRIFRHDNICEFVNSFACHSGVKMGGFSREKCGNTNLVTHKPRKS